MMMRLNQEFAGILSLPNVSELLAIGMQVEGASYYDALGYRGV